MRKLLLATTMLLGTIAHSQPLPTEVCFPATDPHSGLGTNFYKDPSRGAPQMTCMRLTDMDHPNFKTVPPAEAPMLRRYPAGGRPSSCEDGGC
jgi:hypothetical protein